MSDESNKNYLTPECFRKYYSQLTIICPKVTRYSRRQRDRFKKKLKTQLSGKIRVNLEVIQVNNAQINEKTSIKGSSPERSVVSEDQENDVSKDESEIIDVGVENTAPHIIISHESLLQQQQQTAENGYELNLTASIDTECTTVTTTRTNLSLNLQHGKIELPPNNNNNNNDDNNNNNNNDDNNNNQQPEGLSVNIEVPTYDVEKVQNGDTSSESKAEPAKVPTKVFVLNVPRVCTSCYFENPITFDLSKPEDMVKVIAPQIRKLLKKTQDYETLQATTNLQQKYDNNGELIPEEPTTSKRGRKRGTTNNNTSGQPTEMKKKRGRKSKIQVQQESEQRSLTEFYENNGWIFEDQVATPPPDNNENIGLESTVVQNNYVYNNNELVEFPLNPDGCTSVQTLENILNNSGTDPNLNQLLVNNNANNVDLTLNQIYYSVPVHIMNEAISLQNSNNRAEETENQLSATQVNQFGEQYVCPVDESFREGLSMPNLDEMSNLMQPTLETNEITNIVEVKENTIVCPNELEADNENSIANQNNVLDVDDVVGFKEDAEQLMNFNNKGNEELTTKGKNKLEILSVVKLNVPLENIFPQEKLILENGFVELPANKHMGESNQKFVDVENNDKNLNDERDQLVNLKFGKSKRFRQKMKQASLNILKRKKDQIKFVKKLKLIGHIKKKNINDDRVRKTKEKDNNDDGEIATTTKNGLREQQIACKNNELHDEEHENSDCIKEFKLKNFDIKLQRLKTNGRQSWCSKREIHLQRQHQKQLTDICKNIGNNEDTPQTMIEKKEEKEEKEEEVEVDVESLEAKQDLNSVDIVEKKETFENQLENVSQVSFRTLSPDIFDDCLNLVNEAIHSEETECSIMKAEIEKIENVEITCEKYSWAAGSQSPDIFENNDCLLLQTATDGLLCTEKEEKSEPSKQKSPIGYDHGSLNLIDESDNKKQEKFVEEKSMLEQEMDIVNNEILLTDELEDDVLSLSASSLSDFEADEVNVRDNIKMGTQVTPPNFQAPPPPPPQQQQQKKKDTRLPPLAKRSNIDDIMATSTSSKKLLNNNYKIPKLGNSTRTSTQISTSQQAQQQETTITTSALTPKVPSTPISTPIPISTSTPISTSVPPTSAPPRSATTAAAATTTTTKTITMVNQNETTTTTIQHQEKTLQNIRIQIINKNTKYEKYQIVQTPSQTQTETQTETEKQTPLKVDILANHLQTPPGINYGKSSLDLARIFGIDCFEHAFNNEAIPVEMCEKSHNFLPQSEVVSNLSTLSKEDLLTAYRFARNHRRLFEEFFACFTTHMVTRKYVDVLLAMVHDCSLYGDLAAHTLTLLFVSLRQLEMESDVICRVFLKHMLEHVNESYIPVLHSLLGLFLVSGHWTRFTVEINHILDVKNFSMDLKFVSHMVNDCLNTQLDECHTTLTLRCLMSLNSAVLQELRKESNVIMFLHLFNNNSNESLTL